MPAANAGVSTFYKMESRNELRLFLSIALIGMCLTLTKSSVLAQASGQSVDSSKSVLVNGGANTHIDNVMELNSAEDDATPVIMPDEATLYFTSYRDGNKPAVFVARRSSAATWSAPEKYMELPGKESISSITFTSDASHAIVGCCNRADGIGGSCDLYEADVLDGKLQTLHPLSRAVNTEWWEGQPCISQDGQLLFFASDRKHGKGGIDIYMSAKTSNGSWGEPIDLGFNTSGNEMSPMIASDNQTLYFAADDLPGGMGGYDIYVTHRTGENQWTAPKNLGPAVNSKSDEMFFAIPPAEDAIYLASDRPGGLGRFDIYRISPNPVKPVARIIALRGTVLDAETGQPVKATPQIELSVAGSIEPVQNTGQGTGYAAIVPLGKLVRIKADADGYVGGSIEVQSPNDLNPNGFTQDIKLIPSHARVDGHVTNVFTHTAIPTKVSLSELNDDGTVKQTSTFDALADGSYTFNLKPQTKYRVSANVSNYQPYSADLSVPMSNVAMQRISKEIYLTPSDILAVMLLFDFNKEELKSNESPKLTHFIEQVRQNPNVRIEVNGHTDDVGSVEYNAKLSERRAVAVEDFLLSKGVPRDQLAVVKGFGAAQPVDPGITDQARAKNRRVEVRIVGKH
jgi:outer membrane protein OmpA-like peptidoglycan-associated protein/Tol biopolymer transport system component